MILFEIRLQKFTNKGEKTGWIYIEISPERADVLNPGVRVSYRVKGSIDQHPIQQVALLPMGDGGFVLPTNAHLRKAIRKGEGDLVRIELYVDDSPLEYSGDLMECLYDEPQALLYFESLSRGHQNYYTKWVESAKTTETRVKRITQAVQGLAMGMDYGQMIRHFRNRL